MSFTSENSTRRSVGSHAHQVTYLEQTTIKVDGQRVQTITWSAALLRRLEAKGESREQYVARMAERHMPKLDKEWFDNIADDVYELATRRSESRHNVGLTGLWEDGNREDVAELVEEATADLAGNHDTDEA